VSLAAARAELIALVCADTENFTPVAALAGLGVVAAYPSEPINPQKPMSVTIWATGMDPDFYTFEVRVYRSLDTDVLRAQQEFDGVIDVIDAMLGATAHFGPSAWTMGTTGEQDALLASCRLTFGRDTF
jgi:hypothetical protein